MDFVIAIKPLPKRLVKETEENKITVVLSSAEQIAEKDILHRDNSYLKKLQGVCFECFKLNANPPQDVCEIPEREEGPGDLCVGLNCFDYPGSLVSIICLCPQGYPAVETPDLRSGYWVGLQLNNFYSNQVNSGWVVAVHCLSGAIVGAFPVSNAYFGYGRGYILGEEVMIYPAGVVYSVRPPVGDTTYPILGLIPSDGDAIIADGSFVILTTGLPGCPLNPADINVFCTINASNTIVLSDIEECLTLYGEATCDSLGCVNVDNPYKKNNAYYASVGHIPNFDYDAGSAVFSFESSNGLRFCSVAKYERLTSDALLDPNLVICGGGVSILAAYDTCVDCVSLNVRIPCEYLTNLTMGIFNVDYMGYNAAGNAGFGYTAIGPSNPPYIDSDSQVTNIEFWRDWWNWDPTLGKGLREAVWIDNNQNRRFVIPPIEPLLNLCECPCGQIPSGGFTFIEEFEWCCAGDPPIPQYQKTGQTKLTLLKSHAPGLPCVPCRNRCISPKCSCINLENNVSDPDSVDYRHILGPVGNYGYIPCTKCSSSENTDPVINPSIWWLSQFDQDSGGIQPVNRNGQIDPNGPNNSCDSIAAMYMKTTPIIGEDPYLPLHCESPCSRIFEADYVINDITYYKINLENLIACIGSSCTPPDVDPGTDEDRIKCYINDPCFKTKFLPREYVNCDVLLVDGPYTDHRLPSYLKVICGGVDLGYIKDLMCDCTDLTGSSLNNCLINCWLSNVIGPLNTGGKCGVHLAAYADCVIPVNKNTYQNLTNNCNIPVPGNQLALKLEFEGPIRNQKCYEKTKQDKPYDCLTSNNLTLSQSPAIEDECACCRKDIQVEYGKPVVKCIDYTIDYNDDDIIYPDIELTDQIIPNPCNIICPEFGTNTCNECCFGNNGDNCVRAVCPLPDFIIVCEKDPRCGGSDGDDGGDGGDGGTGGNIPTEPSAPIRPPLPNPNPFILGNDD